MRISTSMMHSNALNALLQRQSDVAKTQNEVSSGRRVQKPSDDPAAAVRIQQLEQSKSAATQYGSNITALTTRLNLEEQALNDAESVIQRVSELAIQANSDALSAADRQSIATELEALNEQLLNIANSKDTAGEYLFSGHAASTQPFSRDGAGNVVYSGAPAVRNVQVSASQYVADGDAGYRVFSGIPQGNGLFVTGADAGNSGTAVISGSIQSRADWIPDDYTLTFTSDTAWELRDSSANLVTSGAYSAGSAINFNGVQITLTGTPANGDRFTVAASQSESIFDTLDNLIATVRSAPDTPAQKALFQNQVSAALTQLEQAETHLLSVRTGVGVRSAMLETVDGAREDSLAEIATSISGLRDADYAESVSRLSQQYVGLQAAQQSYAKIAQLSLFDYL